uniref:TATA box-binding protein-like 1 n=1 Tax=Crypthecodinium cohnii TaxID=2866 RepID=Q945B3_CRYCO|nr:TATA box-binding protein-like protein [Crypthecodinium cohnii]|mmetsp:Transcript_5424/g.7650  ORF Transcript_5424/g.7650 Transcript_5424/m.7650 type:complete len:221 (-) Transcript_5424:290-952(-)|eukprot:CAMPEP_0194755592 /NCGR_PEP_ID=MMETSP0323_2-20130528/9441_1 /TAXON_ID=2866 ORGANISM="Crypthecodinium cohnii, Strain Seligo" /NCGR_SAMPLE_ID=MMETSP0323_2 /ASSEMBLY_ACC=CAM_ASM_000346 /LENGTH=220 /DNA_ID=CAMNT_0039674723 /DNA_START=113 /DNA_END=775 /DNA_ORIENTATION=+
MADILEAVIGEPMEPTEPTAEPMQETDLPDNAEDLPEEVAASVTAFTIMAKFNLRCEIDLRQLAFALRHAEYNPRKHSSLTLRLVEPRATAMVRSSGVVSITGVLDLDELKQSAKKVARLVQRSGEGHEKVKFAGFTICSILAKASMGFPIRLDQLAAKWRRNALYEPELYCGCIFRTTRPKCTYLLTSGGKVMISGFRNMEDVHEAVQRIYPILAEFKT